MRAFSDSTSAALGDVNYLAVDTGEGFTLTTFDGEIPNLKPKDMRQLSDDLVKVLPSGFKLDRAKVESGYLSMYEQSNGPGSVTHALFDVLDKLPTGVFKALDNNPGGWQGALRKIARDKRISEKHGDIRDDVIRARQIIGDGPGGLTRLKAALKAGAILPALGAMGAMSALPADESGAISPALGALIFAEVLEASVKQ